MLKSIQNQQEWFRGVFLWSRGLLHSKRHRAKAAKKIANGKLVLINFGPHWLILSGDASKIREVQEKTKTSSPAFLLTSNFDFLDHIDWSRTSENFQTHFKNSKNFSKRFSGLCTTEIPINEGDFEARSELGSHVYFDQQEMLWLHIFDSTGYDAIQELVDECSGVGVKTIIGVPLFFESQVVTSARRAVLIGLLLGADFVLHNSRRKVLSHGVLPRLRISATGLELSQSGYIPNELLAALSPEIGIDRESAEAPELPAAVLSDIPYAQPPAELRRTVLGYLGWKYQAHKQHNRAPFALEPHDV